MKIEKWIDKNTESLKGKTIAITGSTGGLGRYICKHVASLGGNLILVDRNERRSRQHAKEIEETFGVCAKSIIADMNKIGDVEALSQKIQKESVDILILNAGAYSLPREKSSTGYDQVFQINFLSPYYLTKKMIDSLKSRKGKVVVVGSIAHKYSKINENDIDFSKVKAPRKVYGNAKRFLMFSLEKLLEKAGVDYAVAHPGITPTNITSHYPKFIKMISDFSMKMMFTCPRKASLNVVKAVFARLKQGCWVGPRVANIWGFPKVDRLKTCKEEEKSKIFEIAERLCEEIEAGGKVKHELGIQPKYYDLIKNNIKIYEVRLNDDKRRLINVGDNVIIKREPERKEKFVAKVIDKLYFESFRAMAEAIDSRDLGLEGLNVDEIESVYKQFYSVEKEKEFGVVALKLKLS